MYLGSVRFFKHLILFFVTAVIAALGVTVLVMAVKSGEREAEITRLSRRVASLEAVVDFNNGSGEFGPENFYGLMQSFEIDKDEFIGYLYEKDKELFEAVFEEKNPPETAGIAADQTQSGIVTGTEETFPTVPLPVTEETTTTTVPEETTTSETEFYAEYMDMYPHLYAMPDTSGGYIDDADYVYLTFDDGPSVYTGSVLQILNEHDVKATFFVIPDDNDTCKDYLNRILSSGHSLGIHSMSHDYRKIYASVEAFLSDFNEAYNLVYDQTGYKPFLYRFPGGSVNDFNTDTRDAIIAEMTRRGFVYFDWNVDSKDAAGATWTQMYDSVLNDIADLKRSVVLFHDGPSRQNTVYVLEDIVLGLLKSTRGYTLAAIDENTRPEQH